MLWGRTELTIVSVVIGGVDFAVDYVKQLSFCSKFMIVDRRLEALSQRQRFCPSNQEHAAWGVYLQETHLTIRVLWSLHAIGWVDAVHIIGFYHNTENTTLENLSHFYYGVNLSTFGDLKLFDIKHSWKDNVDLGQSVPVLPSCAKQMWGTRGKWRFL